MADLVDGGPCVDGFDSLRAANEDVRVENNLGLYEQLFDYGVRLNRNLIIDPQCAPIMLDAGPNGNQRQCVCSTGILPLGDAVWLRASHHQQLDPIHFDFVSSLDLVDTQPKCRPRCSWPRRQAKAYRTPVRVSSSIVDLDPMYFAEGTRRTPLLRRCSRARFDRTLPKPCQRH